MYLIIEGRMVRVKLFGNRMKQCPEIFLFTCNGVVVDIVKPALRLKSGDTGIMYLRRIVLDPSISPIGKKHNRQHFKFDIILGPYINQETGFCPQVGNYMSKMSFVHFPASLEKKCERAAAAVEKFYERDKNVQDFGIAPNQLGRLLQGQPSCMLVPCNIGCPVEIKSWGGVDYRTRSQAMAQVSERHLLVLC